MFTYDPDALPGTDVDLDLLTFEERDVIDAAEEEQLRVLVTGLPARPGVRR